MTFTGRALFSLGIAVLMAYMVMTSFDYSYRARLFPATIGTIIMIMAILQFIGDVFPASKRYLRFLQQKGVSLEGNVSQPGNAEAKEEVKEASAAEQEAPWLKIYLIFMYLFAFAFLMYYTQFLIAVPVFLILFIWLAGKEKFHIALGISIGTLAVMYILFKVILKVTF